jgi:hypothetical protein
MKLLLNILSLLLTNFICLSQSTIEWQSCYGGQDSDIANAIEQTSDGGFIVAGRQDNPIWGSNDENVWIIKLDGIGVLEWEKSLGGTEDERAHDVKQTSDGGYIVAGYSQSTDGDITNSQGYYDAWIVKLTSSGNIEWEKSLGGTDMDAALSIQQTFDNGYIVAGYSHSTDGHLTANYGAQDCWIVKLDITGTIEWQKTYGGSGLDSGQSIIQTLDSGFVILGSSTSEDMDISSHIGQWDLWLLKISNSGLIQWEKSMGGTLNDIPTSIQQIADTGYIISGYSESFDFHKPLNHGGFDAWIIKTDSIGNFDWQKSLGGSLDDYAYSVRQTSDNGFLVAGSSESTDGDISNNLGNYDVWIVKLGNNGHLNWEKSFGGSQYDKASCVRETSDNGCIIAGNTFSTDGDITNNNNGSHDCWVVKLSNVLGSEELIKEQIGLFPNPATNVIRIEMNYPIQNADYIVFDCTGTKVLSGVLNQEYQTIDISNLSFGMYSVQVQSTERLYNVRFIKR